MGINSRLRTTLAIGLALIVVAIAVVLVIAAGGDDDDGGADASETQTSAAADPTASTGSSRPSASESPKDPKKPKDSKTSDPGETGPTVARERFCPDLDPGAVSEALGVDGLVVLADHAPGDSYPLGPGQADTTSEQWICSIGEESGTVAVTWSIWGEPAGEKLLDARLSSQTTQLGGDACEATDEDDLGPDTRGVDCAPEDSSTPGFAAVSRMALAGDSLLECFLGSTDPADLATLQEAAPELCGLFLDAVTS